MASAFYQNVNGTLVPISYQPFVSMTQAELDAFLQSGKRHPEGTIVHVTDGEDKKKIIIPNVTTDANGNFSAGITVADGFIISGYSTSTSGTYKLNQHVYNNRSWYLTAFLTDMSIARNTNIGDVVILVEKV